MALFTTPGASLGGIPGSAALARLLVVISGNTQGLVNSLNSATGSLSGFQNNANALGNSITRSITLPTLALGGAVVKVAGDFEAAMARVAGLTTLPADRIDEFRQKILDLVASPDIIAGPTELADSLFFAGSAGLSASQAMEVVELSAKGASVQMGEASDISRVLISALNAFGDQGLTAAEAMDALAAAIKAGTAEPDELAIALGRLLPIANEVGLSFQETVAQVAALTNIGVPTRVATTALRALFNQFLAPTELARENLEKLNISYDELQEAIKAGPLVAFKLLHREAQGNNEVIRDIIPQVRALTAFFGLADEKAGDTARVLNLVRNSAGSLDKVLDEFKDTPFFKFQDAIGELKLAAISLGGVILPVFNQLVGLLGDIGQGIQAIPGPMKVALISFLGLVAAMGPALKVFAALQSTQGVFLGSLASTAKGFLTLAAAATLAVGALESFASGGGSIISFAVGLVGAFTSIAIALGFLRKAILATRLDSFISAIIASLTGGQIAAIAAGLTVLVGVFVLMRREAARVTDETKEFREALVSAAAGGQTFAQLFKELRQNVDADIAERLIAIAKAAGLLGRVPVSEGFGRFIDSIGNDLVVALEALDSTSIKTSPRLRQLGRVLARAAAEGRDLGPALRDAGSSSEEFNNLLEDFENQAPGLLHGLTEDVDVLAKAYANAIGAQKDFQIQQAATIAAVGLEEGAVRDLADRYGVSYDFMSEKLGEFGVNASDLSEENARLFAREAGLVEGTAGRIVNARREAAQVEAEVIASRQESLTSAIEFFTEIENLSKASTAKIIEDSNKVASAQINFARNVRTLLRRGVDPSALQSLVDQGPVAVARFVKLSDKELKRWETNFAIAMAAGDAVVLNEGKHLEGKGNAMIAAFTEKILSNKNLSVGAMRQIMQAMQDEVINGDIPKSALPLIAQFAENLSTDPGIAAREVGPVVAALIRRLSDRPKILQAGRSTIFNWVQGIAEQRGLSSTEGALVAQLFIDKLEAAGILAQTEGSEAVQSWGRGVAQQTGLVNSVGGEMAGRFRESLSIDLGPLGAAVARGFIGGFATQIRESTPAITAAVNGFRNKLDNELHSSPNYFTYYMGQELTKQMYEGMQKQGRIMRPVVLATNQNASMDRLAGAIARDRDPHGPNFHHDTRGHVKIDSYLVGRTERMNRLRKAERV